MTVDELVRRLKAVQKQVLDASEVACTVGHYDSVRILVEAQTELNHILFELVNQGVLLAVLPQEEGLW